MENAQKIIDLFEQLLEKERILEQTKNEKWELYMSKQEDAQKHEKVVSGLKEEIVKQNQDLQT